MFAMIILYRQARILNNILQKINQKQELNEKAVASLALTPITDGVTNIKDRILNVIDISTHIESDTAYNLTSVMLAFAAKFLSNPEIEEVKRRIAMTKIGQMI